MSDVTIVSTTADVTVLSTEREVTFVQVGMQGPSGAATTAQAAGNLIAEATPKTTPVDADSLGLSDSESGGILRKLTWGAFKAAFNGIFARLAGVSGGQTLIGGTGSGDSLTLQGTESNGTTGTDKAVRTLVGDGGALEAITVLNNGNVGISNTAPGQLLSIGSTIPVNVLSAGRVAIGDAAGLGAYRGYFDVAVALPDDNAYRWAALAYTNNLSPTATVSMTRYGIYGLTQIPADNSQTITASVRGLQSLVKDFGSGNLSGGAYGCFNSVDYQGSGSKGSVIGATSSISTGGTGAIAISSARSVQAGIYNNGSAATITAAQVVKVELSNAGVIGDLVGLAISTPTSWTNTGTINNCTAIAIGATTAIGTNKKAIDCQSTANSCFMGPVGVGVATPSAKVHVLGTTEQLRLGYDAANYASFTVNATGQLKIAAPLTWRPPASYTPASNGDLTVEATSNTSLTFRLKGSDGTVRSASLTLS